MGFRRRPRKGKRTYKPKIVASSLSIDGLKKMMKSIALKQCETKKSNHTAENLSLEHNVTKYHANLFWTTTGPGNPDGFTEFDRNRNGDEIVARGAKFRWWISNKLDRPNVMYRIFVYLYNTEFVNLDDAEFWRGEDGQGSDMNRMIDMPNNNRIKLLKSITINSKSQYGNLADGAGSDGREHSQLRELYVPLNNKKIKYRIDNEATPTTLDLGFSIVAYDAYGTHETDNIASYAYSYTLYYKDP